MLIDAGRRQPLVAVRWRNSGTVDAGARIRREDWAQRGGPPVNRPNCGKLAPSRTGAAGIRNIAACSTTSATSCCSVQALMMS